ncbi:MAG: hypothetical protein KC445_19695 [Anaerolineales bacterium]|nr:hypothetical protein [Anaerolineales bacterium]
MLYKRKYWYPSQDETFEYGCFVVIPSALFALLAISLLLPFLQALLVGSFVVVGTAVLLHYQNRREKNSVQKAFWLSAARMNEIVEAVLMEKQLPYDKLSKGRNNVYLLNDDGIEITVGPYIYTVRRTGGRSTTVEDGILVKMSSQVSPHDLVLKGIQKKIDEKIRLWDAV